MQNLKSLSNDALLKNTQALAAEERKLTTSILWHLHEIQMRRLYAEIGYGSLFEYAVKALGYSEAAAGRRISAMRLLADIPEIEPALKDGSVNLSTLSTIQTFIQRKEEPVSKSEKRELVFALQGKSRRECEKHLVALDPMAATPKERERVVSPTQTEICFVADDALMEKLQKIQELDGHVSAGASYLELFHRMADLTLKKLDPMAKKKSEGVIAPPAEWSRDKVDQLAQLPSAQKAASQQVSDSSQRMNSLPKWENNSNSRYISASLKREVWKRDQGRCSFRSSDGRRCTSKFALEIDHFQPLALGGKTEASNLRLLCRVHNQQQAVLKLGEDRMSVFIRRFA